MLSPGDLKNIPEHTAYRMMMRHGSDTLLRALHGEPPPEPPHEPTRFNVTGRVRRGTVYIPVLLRPPVHIPGEVQTILDAVAKAFQIEPETLSGHGRSQIGVLARAVAIRLIRDRTWENGEPRHSTPMIGGYLNREHTTICHALSMFENYCLHWPEVAEIYRGLKA